MLRNTRILTLMYLRAKFYSGTNQTCSGAKASVSKVVSKTGNSLAKHTEESDHVHPTLTKHGRKMDEAIIKVDDALPWLRFRDDTAVMIEALTVSSLLIQVSRFEMAQWVKEQFRQITDKPVKAIIYSIPACYLWCSLHGLLTKKWHQGEVKIIAEEGLAAMANWSSNLGNSVGHRASYAAPARRRRRARSIKRWPWSTLHARCYLVH